MKILQFFKNIFSKNKIKAIEAPKEEIKEEVQPSRENESFKQQIKIGNNIRLGAGSVLMTKPKNGNLYIGNPAKKFEF